MGNIVCLWLLASTFLSGFAVAMVQLLISPGVGEPTPTIVVELVLGAGEVGVLVALAVLSMRERKLYGGNGRWYRLRLNQAAEDEGQ
jgi:hypothetical protein